MTADHDVPDDRDAQGLVSFAYEMGVLKRLRRTGWAHAGIRDAESVAEHSFRASQLAALIAVQEGGDPARAALLALWHDSQETRTGDLPHTAQPYVGRADPIAITADQIHRLPETAAKMVREAVLEYEAGATIEARSAHDADKLECLLQAVEYRSAGNHNVQGWIDSSRQVLVTDSAVRIADAALTTSQLTWRDR